MSEQQAVTAVRVANVPEDRFEEMAGKATVTEIAEAALSAFHRRIRQQDE